MSSRILVAMLAAGCLTAAAGGAYVAVRQNAPAAAVAALSGLKKRLVYARALELAQARPRVDTEGDTGEGDTGDDVGADKDDGQA